jgi:hypothetical protein
MKGTVEKIWENRSKNGQKYLSLVIDSQKYSFWDEKYFDQIQEGMLIDFDWKKSGKFKNIIKITPREEDNLYSDRRQESIIRMSCLRSASEILSGSKIPYEQRMDKAIEIARKFEKYIEEEDIDSKLR